MRRRSSSRSFSASPSICNQRRSWSKCCCG